MKEKPEYDGVKAMPKEKQARYFVMYNRLSRYISAEGESRQVAQNLKLEEMARIMEKFLESQFSTTIPQPFWGKISMEYEVENDIDYSFPYFHGPLVFNGATIYPEWSKLLYNNGEGETLTHYSKRGRCLHDIRLHLRNTFSMKLDDNRRRTAGLIDHHLWVWESVLNGRTMNKLDRHRANVVLSDPYWIPTNKEKEYTPSVEWFEPFMLDITVAHGDGLE